MLSSVYALNNPSNMDVVTYSTPEPIAPPINDLHIEISPGTKGPMNFISLSSVYSSAPPNRIDDISTIKATAKSRFYYRNINILLCKIFECQCRCKLKKTRM